MKAALYHYFMNDRDAIDEVRGQNAPVPSRAYGMAIHKFKDMHHSRKDYSFCCEVLNRQEQAFEGRKAMLQAARQRHFPK